MLLLTVPAAVSRIGKATEICQMSVPSIVRMFGCTTSADHIWKEIPKVLGDFLAQSPAVTALEHHRSRRQPQDDAALGPRAVLGRG